ncbi:hypothetical protein Tco_1023278 [Tanacetum coccineum]
MNQNYRLVDSDIELNSKFDHVVAAIERSLIFIKGMFFGSLLIAGDAMFVTPQDLYILHKGSEVGRGVTEKQVLMADKSIEVGKHVNVTGEQVVKEKLSSLVDASTPNIENTSLNSYLPFLRRDLLRLVITLSIRAVSERFANTAYCFFLGKRVAYLVVANYGMSSYARAMIELRADVELKDTIVVAMPKLTKEGFYTCTEECPKNPGFSVAKNLKKPSQAPKGVPVGQKVGFKSAKECRPISKKPTANTSGNKKKDVEPTKEVSNSNPFDVLNLVDNDGELGTNGGTLNLASNEVNSSGFSFWNVETSSTITTPIVDKIRKIENIIIDGKVTLMDDDGKPLKKVNYPGDQDSEDEVESVDNDMAHSMALETVGFGTQSLLEQWRDSYKNGDYDEDPYNDDMYEGQDLLDKIQDICDNLDIKVRGRRKK